MRTPAVAGAPLPRASQGKGRGVPRLPQLSTREYRQKPLAVVLGGSKEGEKRVKMVTGVHSYLTEAGGAIGALCSGKTSAAGDLGAWGGAR